MIDPVKENSPNASNNHTDPEEGAIVSDPPVGIGSTSTESALRGRDCATSAEKELVYHLPTRKTTKEAQIDKRSLTWGDAPKPTNNSCEQPDPTPVDFFHVSKESEITLEPTPKNNSSKEDGPPASEYGKDNNPEENFYPTERRAHGSANPLSPRQDPIIEQYPKQWS